MRAENIVVGLEIENEALRFELASFFAIQTGYRLQSSEDTESPQLVIIEMDIDRDKAFSHIRELQSASPQTQLIVTASDTDPEVLLNLLRVGVQEFLPQPVHKEDLHCALKRFEDRYNDSHRQSGKRGKLVNVFGSKGGVGTTTLAVNLAVSLQEINRARSVVLVDLNLQFGDVALFLDIEPAYTFGDVMSNPSRLDETFLTGTLTRHPSGLYLLPSAESVHETSEWTLECIEQSLELLQNMFDYVIIDSGHVVDEITLTTLNKPSTLLIVSTLTLPVVRNTRRLVTLLSNLNYPTEDIEIIINRYKSKYEISLRDFEESLNKRPFGIIPNDYQKASYTINRGSTFFNVYRKSKITKSVKSIASKLSEEQKSNHLFSKFLHNID